MRRLPSLTALLLIVSSLVGVGLLTASPASAYLTNYPQDGWHAQSVFDDGASRSTTVIDCKSTIINNMGGGTSYSSDGWTYTPPMPTMPSTGIIAAMGTEVDLDGGHPRVGESFYIHVWARSISTPCNLQGVVPVFQLPAGVTIDTSMQTFCFSDGKAENTVTCPQPGSAKFQSAQGSTGLPNSYQILCGYAKGCFDTYYWPAVYGHGFEFAIPVKSSTTFNGSIGGGAVINTGDVPKFYQMSSNINVFAATAGNGQIPTVTTPATSTTPAVQDPGTAYRVRYDDPSTLTRSNYVLQPATTTKYGVLSRAEVFTNHVPGQVVFVRDTVKSKVSSAPLTVSSFDAYATQVAQMAIGTIDNVGASYQSEFDWQPTPAGWGNNPSLPVAAGTTYYWRYGYVPEPDGTHPSGEIIWGTVQSFVKAASSCNGKLITVNIGLGEFPTPGNDVIEGTPGNDTINGLGGNDTICGEGGNDTIDGGAGNDTILGGAGNDNLIGGVGNDTLIGGIGRDALFPGAGHNTVRGDAGDTAIYADVPGGVTASLAPGVAGSDVITGINRLVGSPGPDKLFGSVRNDLIKGVNGNDVINGVGGNDFLDGGNGADTINGGVGADKLYGQAGNDVLRGGAGPDKLFGGPGADRLFGEGGADALDGGIGPDYLAGGLARDVCVGGPQRDVAATCEVRRTIP